MQATLNITATEGIYTATATTDFAAAQSTGVTPAEAIERTLAALSLDGFRVSRARVERFQGDSDFVGSLAGSTWNMVVGMVSRVRGA